VTTTLLAVLAAVVLTLLVTAVLGVSRLQVLSGRIGSFECAARAVGDPAGAWTAGIAHYGAGRIDWWRAWSLAPRPRRTWCRSDLHVMSRSPVVGAGGDALVVRCRDGDEEFELTMTADAFAGLTAWLEAAPPTDISRVI
jgi:Protein of unknown function (DUF2550)